MALIVLLDLSNIPLTALRSYEGVLVSRRQPSGQLKGQLGPSIHGSRDKATRPAAIHHSPLMSPGLSHFLLVSGPYNWI